MDTVLVVVTLVVIAAHLAVAGFVWQQRNNARGGHLWLLAAIGLSALACATYLLPENSRFDNGIGREFAALLLLIATQVAAGTIVIFDLVPASARHRTLQLWLGICGLWAAGLLAAAALADTVTAGQSEWLVDLVKNPDVTGIVVIGAFISLSLGLMGLALRHFYLADLAEFANRALFWVLFQAVLLIGLVLTGSGTPVLAVLGMAALLAAVAALATGYLSFRVFNIRSGMILTLRTLAFVSLTAVILFATLYVMLGSGIDTNDSEGLLVTGALALTIAALFVPLWQIVSFSIQQIARRRAPDPVQAAREYSRNILETVTLDELVLAATGTLNRVMRVRRSCMILFHSTFEEDKVELLVKQSGGLADGHKGSLAISSPIYDTLAIRKKPLTQFDIEMNPGYAAADDEERAFFKQLKMNAYAPVTLESRLIGLLACGPYVSDAAFYEQDLTLLATLAEQTGVALRNARLLDDLRHLNRSMQSLNKELKDTNLQLNKLDSVKTDFITIASHELRTPLAQIRGYTDILDAMNEQGLLDPDQTTLHVGNLRKATERMEELISAMLDVSQLDVNAMDLRFSHTPPESVLRMAIEPLNDAIRQRKLTLVARGLSGLPPIPADLPRLVQAFRNIIVNAIKFTPDGGRIFIQASLQPAGGAIKQDHVTIEIRDTGVGVDAKNLDLIFNKFFRAYDPALHSTGTYKFMGAGPGLGLTIAKGVIEGHGGKIWAESPGHDMEGNPGSTFFVLLPVTTPDDARRVLSFEGRSGDKDERPTDPKSPFEKAKPEATQEERT
jgi:signal transduction histidine kinase